MFKDKLKQITKQLYPTGRAFQNRRDGIIERMHDALIESENQLHEDSQSVLDTILPDNDNFLEAEATRWEQRLGMITNSSVPLAERKLAIIRKMNHPGTILARQSHDYLQDQLQTAGFDVYVHENIPEQTVQQILAPFTNSGQLGNFQLGQKQLGSVLSFYSELFNCSQLGQFQLGQKRLGSCSYNNKVANYIDEQKDANFNTGSNLKSVFFVGGQVLGTFANVDEDRKDEFRQLILKVKPVQSVGFLFIDYIY